jgi:predicted DNA-binding ribbon-helix-helix protein
MPIAPQTLANDRRHRNRAAAATGSWSEGRRPADCPPEFWNSFKEIADECGMTITAMIGAIDGDRKHVNLSSAIRLFVLGVYRDQITSLGSPLSDVQS